MKKEKLSELIYKLCLYGYYHISNYNQISNFMVPSHLIV